ncbi:hypothetical protein [Labilibaculum euxinus]|uniref:Uncharacterized protein n=1 Tax=Labilibaculum euxinus TaxID=2686357 RepID=A0A7M4D1A5_9BACT|nr:hypothetical protein [Labilibaculum euxinus]MUP36434.1 hypothetical protein [Labilibaculum euxinus]MVB05639.1 hypothetical protein [Labilibaculum euxinus]
MSDTIIEKQIKNKENSSDISKEDLKKKTIENFDDAELKKKISDFLQFVGYRLCLYSFSNLSLSVGTTNMDNIYDTVATRINTPAAKLITFTIKTYYGKLSLPELEELKTEFENNPVATHILKSRVQSYVYNNHVSYEKRQKIIKLLGFRTLPPTTKKLN